MIAVTTAAMVVVLPLELRLEHIGYDRTGCTAHDLAHLAVHQFVTEKSTPTASSHGCQEALVLFAIGPDCPCLPVLSVCVCSAGRCRSLRK